MRVRAQDEHGAMAYVSHSGFGHQLQMLLRGLFLAHAGQRTLLLPPLMTHRGSLDIAGVASQQLTL